VIGTIAIDTGVLWAPVLAALGASALTLGGAFWLEARRRVHAGRAAQQDALRAAVSVMLTESLLMTTLAGSLRLTMQVRSGLAEGLDVLRRGRKPVDPLELHDRMAAALKPIAEAQSVIWVRGRQDHAEAANSLLLRCMDLIDEGTTEGAARSPMETTVRGQEWTEVQQAQLIEKVAAVGIARAHLAELARTHGGMAMIDVLAGD
jgi:hypothetical protein